MTQLEILYFSSFIIELKYYVFFFNININIEIEAEIKMKFIILPLQKF